MASGDERARGLENLDGKGLRLAVVSSRWNASIIERIADGVRRGLDDLGVSDEDTSWATVPGAYELPMAAKTIAESGRVDAIICLGAVIRGETSHYELVSEGAAVGILEAQLQTNVPMAFGLVTVENEAQALARSEGPGGHNVGEEAAMVAVEMARFRENWSS